MGYSFFKINCTEATYLVAELMEGFQPLVYNNAYSVFTMCNPYCLDIFRIVTLNFPI